jgi:hypothetical protein
MERKKLISEQIEYHSDADTWVPRREFLTGTINFQHKGWRGEPLIVIDGVELSWHEFAQTMLTHEGFKFRFEFIDPSKA